jgi:uncharacterized protein (TIGR01777 family)
MKVLIAGGSGFLGTALADHLRSAGHLVWILTRRVSLIEQQIHWDGVTAAGWADRIGEFDAVVNMTGFGLEHWPWTKSQKQRFQDSRILPGHALVAAIERSSHRPGVFVQISGINYYGLTGDTIADEWTPPGNDYLAQLAVQWEAATRIVENSGVRYAAARTAVVLDAKYGQFPLMVLPVRLFFGGRLGDGHQAVPWIHLADQIGAIRYILENAKASGAINLISPTPTSNEEFMRAIAKCLHRPYWFPTPAFALRAVLGEMSTLVISGRYCMPKRLLEFGYNFRYPTIESALNDLFSV